MNATNRPNSAYPRETAVKNIQVIAGQAATFLKRACRLGKGSRAGIAILTACAAITNLSLAKDASIGAQTPPSVVYRYSLNPSSRYFPSGIKDPYHPQEYIRQLAGKLGEENARKLLLEGLGVSLPKPGGPKEAYITATVEPEPRDFTDELQKGLSQAGTMESLDRSAQFRAKDRKIFCPLFVGNIFINTIIPYCARPFHLTRQILKGIKPNFSSQRTSFMCKDCEYGKPCRAWQGN